MHIFLYRFGFESPRQFQNNDLHGWDDEDSQCLLIEADDAAAAIAWGQEVSERFVIALFRDGGISWRRLGYASWIEERGAPCPDVQQVRVGEVPDFTPWLKPYERET